MIARAILGLGVVAMVDWSDVSAQEQLVFDVGEPEVIATRPQLVELGLNWFIDGNLGVLKEDGKVVMYGGNGARPVRVTGTHEGHFQAIESVTIQSDDERYKYLSGGPVYRDPETGRVLLFYHAEVYRSSARNFYSVVGLSVQVDEEGLVFKDVGPVFVANLSEREAAYPVEVCGAAFVLRDGDLLVYARDELRTDDASLGGNVKSMAEINEALERDGYGKLSDDSGADLKQSNLSAARARLSEVIESAEKGRPATWQKYFNGEFSEPSLGGQSSPLEQGNPRTRWMDVSYNTAIQKYIMIVATTLPGSEETKAELHVTWSNDGIHWAERLPLADDGGEMFYPSIVGIESKQRESGETFYVYYTFSEAGAWDRWNDAKIIRRKVSVRRASD